MSNYINTLQEREAKGKHANPIYSLIEKRGLEHLPEFKYRVQLANGNVAESSAYFPTVKEAKQDAARVMLQEKVQWKQVQINVLAILNSIHGEANRPSQFSFSDASLQQDVLKVVQTMNIKWTSSAEGFFQFYS